MKITGLPARAAVALTDIMAIVDASGAVPATWKATIAQVRATLMPIVLTVDVLGLLPLANQAAPTGTGVIKGVAGAWGAAAGLVVDADVAAGAAVAVAKLAPGANTQVLTTTAGVTVWAAAAGGGTVPTGTGFSHTTVGALDVASKKVDLTAAADVTVPATVGGVVTSSGTVLQQAANVLAGAGFISIGAGGSPAAAGLLRVDYNASARVVLAERNSGGTSDYTIITTTGGTSTTFGDTTGQINTIVQGYQNFINAATGASTDFGIGASFCLLLNGSSIQASQPIIGDTRASSPYGAHGVGTQAMPVGVTATTTLAAAVYKFNTVKTTGALTANQNLVFPAAADAAGYTKVINNACTGAFSIIVGDGGAGTTVTVGLGGTTTVLFDSRGATQVGVGFATAGGTPTGTGFSHTTLGALDASSKKVDLTAAADVTVPATAGGVVTSSGTALQQASNVLAGTGFISVGATAPPAGSVRIGYSAGTTQALTVADATGTASRNILRTAGDASTTFGDSILNTAILGAIAQVTGTSLTGLYVGAGYGLVLDTAKAALAVPIVGDSNATSPYGVHGKVTDATVGTFTLTAASYKYDAIQLTGGTAGTVTFPASTDATAYCKTIINTSGVIKTLSNGGATTLAIASGNVGRVMFDTAGAHNVCNTVGWL